MMNRSVLFLLVWLTYAIAFAQTVPNDSDYKIHQTEDYRIIYSAEYEALIPELVSFNKWFQNRYQKEFSWKFDEDAVLVLASSRNQIANGFATQYPRLMTFFYGGGAQLIDEFAAHSWLYTLLTHETVHLYQLNVRHGYSSALKSVFGNALPNFLPPFTYTITPHLFTPTFIMEGNATFNESRFGNGGRLHSGLYRALFLQMLKNGNVTANRLINDHIEWPFTTEKYIIGGYLQSYLAETYGTERTNHYFNIHAHNKFLPLMINRSFKDTFGTGYNEAIDGFRVRYKKLAEDQQSEKSKAIATSFAHQGFTEHGGQILFMTTDYVSDPKICVLQKASGDLQCKRHRLPFGRVFRYDGQFVTAASEPVSTTEIRFSLFADGYKEVGSHRNHLVYWMNGDDVLYADIPKSFKVTQLYHNGQFINETHSSPYRTAAQDTYYFKQEGPKRSLYKNRTAVFHVPGSYGKVTDVLADGTIYFTGTTDKGSTLFQWRGGKIKRILASDAAVDAKRLGDGRFLICEITASGYQFKFAKPIDADEGPARLQYKHDDEKELSVLSDINDTAAPGKKALTASDPAYKPFFNIEFNGVDPLVLYASDQGFLWALAARFSDPLQKYFLNFLLQDTGFESYGATVQFINAKKRLQWVFQASYEMDAVTRESSSNSEELELIGHYADTEVNVGWRYPIWTHPLWNSSSALLYQYENREILDDSIFSYTSERSKNAVLAQVNLGYGVSYPLNFDSYRLYEMSLSYKHEGLDKDWKQPVDVYVGDAKLNYDLGWETFLYADYKYASTHGDRRGLELDDDLISATLDPTEFFSKAGDDFFGLYHDLAKVTTQLKKSFHIGLYNSVVPIGLSRLAPFVGYNEYYGAVFVDDKMETLFHETYYGADIELLLLHKFRLRVTAMSVDPSYEDFKVFRLSTAANWSF